MDGLGPLLKELCVCLPFAWSGLFVIVSFKEKSRPEFGRVELLQDEKAQYSVRPVSF